MLIKNVSDTDGTWKETIYYVSAAFVMVENSSGRYNFTYIKHVGQLVAELTAGGAKLFHHPDHLGSTTLITDSSGSALENTSYTPYGVILTGGNESRFQYEGKEYDPSIGQYDFHFRGYKPEWGKFTQPDTLIPNVYDPQSLNRYMFERGNPYRYVDESGHMGLFSNWVQQKVTGLKGYWEEAKSGVTEFWNKVPGNQYIEAAYDVSLIPATYEIVDWYLAEATSAHGKKWGINLGITEEELNQKRLDALFATLSIGVGQYSKATGKMTKLVFGDNVLSATTGRGIFANLFK